LTKEEHYRKLERMYASAPTTKYYMSTIQVSEGHAEVILPVRHDFLHVAGTAHAAVYCKLLDEATVFAVSSVVHDVFVLTASLNIYLTRPVSEGEEMKAIGRVVHCTRRLFIAEAELVDSDGREIARGSGIFMRSTIPLSPEIGYK